MTSNAFTLKKAILLALMLLSFYIVICIRSSGDTLEQMTGVIEQCVILGGNTRDRLSHATIKVDSGSYLISSVSECRVGERINVFVKRGMLYFNSIYVAEKI